MALHRDIYWVGRQWAVTGFGLQAVDQRLRGAFDVEIARLWEDDLARRMRALAWLNLDDFNKALDVARARYPAPPRKNLPLVESVLELIQPISAELAKPAPATETSPSLGVPKAVEKIVEHHPPNMPLLAMRMDRAPAKFLPQWRIRH